MPREEALNAITAFVENYACGSDLDGLRGAIEALKEEKPHGEWIFKNDNPLIPTGYWECSECKKGRLMVEENFCPNCGSDNRKNGEDAPKEHEDKKAKKCPNCGSDLYEYCFMCCYEGKKVGADYEGEKVETKQRDF